MPTKRWQPVIENAPADPKRLRIDIQEGEIQPRSLSAHLGGDSTRTFGEVDEIPATIKSQLLTQHNHARQGIQKSIAIVMDHDGFSSASPSAVECFTELVETCSCCWIKLAPGFSLS